MNYINPAELAMLSRSGNYELTIKKDELQDCWIIHVVEIGQDGGRVEYHLLGTRSKTVKTFKIFDTALGHVLKIVAKLDHWTLQTPDGVWDATRRK